MRCLRNIPYLFSSLYIAVDSYIKMSHMWLYIWLQMWFVLITPFALINRSANVNNIASLALNEPRLIEDILINQMLDTFL